MNPYFLLGAAVAVALAFGSGYYKGNEAGQAEVQQQWDKEKTAQFAEHVKAQAAARQREQELQTNANKLRTEKTLISGSLMLGPLLFLTACGTVQRVPPPMPVPCPVPPALDQVVVPEESYLKKMESFLSGSLEKPTNSASPSNNATPSTKP
jgi:hypothetical protein